jgi:hypothetical protein
MSHISIAAGSGPVAVQRHTEPPSCTTTVIVSSSVSMTSAHTAPSRSANACFCAGV